MSKYYKAEDVERLIENILNVMIGKEEPIETALCELPTIEVSEDCISRDYVRLIESDEDAYYGDWNETYEKGFIDAINKILNAPSVVPSCQKNRQVERAEGEWIEDNLGTVICSECKCPRRDSRINHTRFCNSCGAKMKG